MRTDQIALAAVVLSCFTMPVTHGEVIGWRTNWTGQYPDATPPTTWSRDQNVVWSCKLPSQSNATPIVVGDRIFVTAEPFKLLCISATDGRILWQADNSLMETYQGEDGAKLKELMTSSDAKLAEARELQNRRLRLRRKLERTPDDAAAQQEMAELTPKIEAIEAEVAPLRGLNPPITHDSNGYASPTPVSDGQRVFAHFGNGVAAAYDLEGNRLWIRVVQRPEHEWGHSSSPLIIGETLVVLVTDLHGLDVATGTPRWTARARQRWGSPVQMRIDGTDVVLTPSGEVVAVADGRILAGGVGKLEYATPVVQDGVVYFIENTSRALRLPKSAADALQFTELWSVRVEGDRHYASPIIHEGLVYTISRRENLTVLDATTGAKVYERQLQLGGSTNSAYPSVTLAGPAGGELLYVSSETGATVVMRPGREYQEVARNQMPAFRGSPVFVGNRLYLRCFDALYCISEIRTAATP